MASLNTLRTKFGWILSIVIGLALLAFILPEVFRGTGGGNNPNKLKIGEIDGQKVTYTEYYNQSEYYNTVMSAYYGRNNFSATEADQIRDMAWNAMIMQKAYIPGMEKLGLMPLEAEQTDMVTGVYISPVIQREFSNPQTGMFDPALLKGFVGNLDLNPNGRMMWEYIKGQMIEQRGLLKYMTLVAAGVNVSKMEVEEQIAANSNIYSASVVSLPFAEISDSLVKVTDADMRKYYDERKEAFREAASRDIEYVVFDILPSQEDYAAAKETVDEIASEFAVSTTPVQYASVNTQSQPDAGYKSLDQIDPAIAAVIWDKPEAMYGPVLSNDVYTMARLGEVKMMPDSIGARHILLPPTSTQLADSLVGVLRSGSNFGELASLFSTDPSAKQNMGDLGNFAPETMIPEFSEAVLQHKTGDVFTVATQFGLHVVQVTYIGPATKKAQVAMIQYNVDAGNMTEMAVLNMAQEFFQAAKGSYDNFRKAVADKVLSKRVQRVMNTDRNVSGLPESRELVRWAFSNNAGDVSNEMKIGNESYVVAVITAAREDGIAPMEQYKDEIRMAVTLQKKGEMLAAKMTGNTIGEIAAATDKEIVPVEGVQFQANAVPGIGAEPKLVGAIASGVVSDGKVSKPVVGNFGVYSFAVDAKSANAELNPETERIMLETSSQMYLDQRLMQALLGVAKVIDGRVRYF